MPLLDIINSVAADLGAKPASNTDQRSLIIKRINEAAIEMYDKTDLVNSLLEQVFDLDVESAQVSLPFYVGDVRGFRHYDARLRISINTHAPRYHYGQAHEVWPLKYRRLNKSPLERNISNESVLKFTIPVVEASDIVLKIVGQTSNSAQAEETVTIVAGTLEAFSVGNFIMPLISLRKEDYNTYNISVFDVEDNLLAVIPNSELFSEYNIFQVLDHDTTTNTAVIECLYKRRFTPLRNDYDTFLEGKYDKAIYWKYFEHEMARQQKYDQAVLAAGKCDAIIGEIMENTTVGMELETNFAPCPYYDMSYYAVGGGRRGGYPMIIHGY